MCIAYAYCVHCVYNDGMNLNVTISAKAALIAHEFWPEVLICKTSTPVKLLLCYMKSHISLHGTPSYLATRCLLLHVQAVHKTFNTNTDEISLSYTIRESAGCKLYF